MSSQAERDLISGVKKLGQSFKKFGKSKDVKADTGVSAASPSGSKTAVEVVPPTPGLDKEDAPPTASPLASPGAAVAAPTSEGSEPVLEPEALHTGDGVAAASHVAADDPSSDIEDGGELVLGEPGSEAGSGAVPPPTSAELVAAPETEVERLRREAELLEVNAHGALAEASADKIREDAARAAAAAAAAQEELQYAAAESAEAERRAVIERARPLALRAHESELEAVRVRRDAAETEFHAQVLEKRAAALLAESAELDAHSEQRLVEAEDLDADADAARAVHEKLLSKAESHVVGDLPSYAEQCKLEIAKLNARIADLREEVAWAEAEIQRVHKDGDDWRRIAGRKATELSRLQLAAATAREEAALARERAREAALEARTPAELAETKYSEAKQLAERASDLESEAHAQHQEVLAITSAATAPVTERNARLADAAVAELKSKALVQQADVVSERIERRLFESQVHADTAARYKAAADAAEADAAFEAGRLEGAEGGAAATAADEAGAAAAAVSETSASDFPRLADAEAAAAADAHIDTPPASPTHVQ